MLGLKINKRKTTTGKKNKTKQPCTFKLQNEDVLQYAMGLYEISIFFPMTAQMQKCKNI